MKTSTRVLVPLVIAVLYFVFPVDLIPDVIPVLGQMDDVIVLVISILRSLRAIRVKAGR